MSETTQTLDIWGIVELFGHSKVAGKLTEQNIAGTNMLRVDVPETEKQPAFTKFYGSAAIYAINPVTEEVAKAKAHQLSVAPIDAWDIRTMTDKIMQLQKNALPESDLEEDEMPMDDEEDYLPRAY